MEVVISIIKILYNHLDSLDVVNCRQLLLASEDCHAICGVLAQMGVEGGSATERRPRLYNNVISIRLEKFRESISIPWS